MLISIDGHGLGACRIGVQRPEVPQMALKSCLPLAPPTAEVPQIAEFRPEKTLRPQIAAVLTGVARRTAALFTVDWTIELISDDCRFFMSFAFLLHRVENHSAGLISRSTCTPDYVGAPNHI